MGTTGTPEPGRAAPGTPTHTDVRKKAPPAMVTFITNKMPSTNVNVSIEAETDDGPFLSIAVQDDETGRDLLDIICLDATEVEQFFTEVAEVRERWNALRSA